MAEKVTSTEEVVEKKTTKKATKKIPANKNVEFTATGRRKNSVARVRLIPNGKGQFTINKVNIDEYFKLGVYKLVSNQPFEVTNTIGKYDVIVNVNGGGLSGQAGAIRHGLARALVAANEENKSALKAAGFLTRDPRMKERKKPGLKKARKAPQFSKR